MGLIKADQAMLKMNRGIPMNSTAGVIKERVFVRSFSKDKIVLFGTHIVSDGVILQTQIFLMKETILKEGIWKSQHMNGLDGNVKMKRDRIRINGTIA